MFERNRNYYGTGGNRAERRRARHQTKVANRRRVREAARRQSQDRKH